jgi:hypothetical protein
VVVVVVLVVLVVDLVVLVPVELVVVWCVNKGLMDDIFIKNVA